MEENTEKKELHTTSKNTKKKKPETLEELQAAKQEKEEQIKQLKKESTTLGRRIGAKNRILKQEKARAEKLERKRARTHRLCVIGGIIESAAACEIANFEAFKEWAYRFGYKIKGTQGLPEESPSAEQRAEFDAKQAIIDAPIDTGGKR